MRDDFGWFRQTLTAMLFGMLLMAGFPAGAAQVGGDPSTATAPVD